MIAITVLLFLLISEFSFSTTTPNPIPLGSSLSSNSNNSWLSDSGEFAFGFYREGNGDYSVGIWYAKTSPKTVVWSTNGPDSSSPSPGDDQTVSLNRNGMLWQGEIIAQVSQPAESASMLDSGNFVLYGANRSVLWQSFDSPTDTLLPGQKLKAGNILVSATGRFLLSMQMDGNLVLYPKISAGLSPYHAYWNTRTWNAGNNVSLNLDTNGSLYLLNSTTGSYILNITSEQRSSDDLNGMFRLTLDSDGILRLYNLSLVENSSSWNVQWTATSACHPTGICGQNAYCSLVEERPKCLCIPGFEFIDEEKKDLGCERNSSLDVCSGKIDDRSISTKKFDGVMWEDKATWSSLSSEVDCENECLRDCECVVALFRNHNCSKQALPLRFSRVVERGLETTTLVKVIEATEKERGGRNGDVKTGVLISGVVLLSFGLIALVVSFTILYRVRKSRYGKIAYQSYEEFLEEVTLRPYTFVELEKVTNGFQDQLGCGGFGTVFKGVIASKSCSKVVAIKRLERVIIDDEREFRNEMKVIGKTHHKICSNFLGTAMKEQIGFWCMSSCKNSP